MAFKRAGKFEARGPSRDRDDRPRFGDRQGGGRSFDKKPFTRSAGNGPIELFDVKCARCGNDTKVPFKPTGERPVYCRECFNKNDDSGPRKSFPSNSSSGPSSNELREINEKLDKIMQALDIE